MGQRGRTSGASLSVVAGTAIDGRPAAPGDLTEFQREVWERTVANEAADVFRTAALQQLLKEYCRHVESAHRVTALIALVEKPGAAVDLDEYEKLLRMRDRETKALADKATKLRLTNQSRYTPQAAATAAKKGATERKPWQMTG
jgi:hypothetical protein